MAAAGGSDPFSFGGSAPAPARGPPVGPDGAIRVKLVMIGDGAVGKTTFVERHISGHFEAQYKATQGASVKAMDFNTNYGPINFIVWDTAGQENFNAVRETYYVGAKCAIIMFDVSSRTTYNSVPNWHRDLTRVTDTPSEHIPIVLVGNKVDIKDRQVKSSKISFHRRKGIMYCDVSAKTNFNFEQPFLVLARQLTGKKDLRFVDKPALVAPEAGYVVTEERKRELDAERLKAMTAELPDDDEDL